MRISSGWFRTACTALAVPLIAIVPALAAPAAPDIDIVKVEFGIFEDDGSDQLGFGASSDIPLVVGQAYGWLIQLRSKQKSVAVREEALLPQPGSTVTESPDTDLTPSTSRDVLYGFNERRMPVADGNVFGVRRVEPGDAPGRYRLKVFIERKLAATFDYALHAPEAPAEPAAANSGPPPKKETSRPPRPGPRAPVR